MPTTCSDRSRQSNRAALLSRSLQEISPGSPDRGVLLGKGFETLSFPLATRCFGKHKNCCSGLNCADNCTRSGIGVCLIPLGGSENEQNSLSVMERTERTRHCGIRGHAGSDTGDRGGHDSADWLQRQHCFLLSCQFCSVISLWQGVRGCQAAPLRDMSEKNNAVVGIGMQLITLLPNASLRLPNAINFENSPAVRIRF